MVSRIYNTAKCGRPNFYSFYENQPASGLKYYHVHYTAMDLLLASGPSQPHSHALQRDFESHKDTISHLYVNSNLTLRNVIKEMEQQHKFRATYISKSLMRIYC